MTLKKIRGRYSATARNYPDKVRIPTAKAGIRFLSATGLHERFGQFFTVLLGLSVIVVLLDNLYACTGDVCHIMHRQTVINGYRDGGMPEHIGIEFER